MAKTAEPIMLDHRVDLYIPSKCICTGSLPEVGRTKVIEEVKGNFDNWFGGHAEIPIKGDWRLPDGHGHFAACLGFGRFGGRRGTGRQHNGHGHQHTQQAPCGFG